MTWYEQVADDPRHIEAVAQELEVGEQVRVHDADGRTLSGEMFEAMDFQESMNRLAGAFLHETTGQRVGIYLAVDSDGGFDSACVMYNGQKAAITALEVGE